MAASDDEIDFAHQDYVRKFTTFFSDYARLVRSAAHVQPRPLSPLSRR